MPSNKKLSILEAATRALVRSPRTTTCGESVPTMREGRGYLPEEGCLGSKYGDKLLERPNSRNIKRRPDAVGFGCDAELYRKEHLQ